MSRRIFFWQISRVTQETRRRISLFCEVTPRKTALTRRRGVGSLAESLYRRESERIHSVEEFLIRSHGARLGPCAQFLDVFCPRHAERLSAVNFRK